jgi:hypothetical protein
MKLFAQSVRYSFGGPMLDVVSCVVAHAMCFTKRLLVS